MIENMSLPDDLSKILGRRVRDLRRSKKWRQDILSAKAQVPIATLRRFERSGKGTVVTFLRLAFALGRSSDFAELLIPPPAQSLAELEALERRRRKKKR